jgi:transcriptional regulator with XRE-family HTH domain
MSLSKADIARRLGQLIKRLRNEHSGRLNQGEFGRLVLGRPEDDDKACQSWVSRIELGNFSKQMSDVIILKIADVLGVKPDEMLGLWAQYINAGDVKPDTAPPGTLDINPKVLRRYPNIKGYLDSFFNIAELGDSEAMAGILMRMADYVKSVKSE